MAETYFVKPQFLKTHPNAVTLVDGVPVALSGNAITIENAATLTHPPKKRIIRGATMDDFRHLFAEKHPAIEMKHTKDSPKKDQNPDV